MTKSWTLREDGRLLVSVTLNPKGERKRVFNRVFDLVPEEPAEADAEDAQDAETQSASTSS